MAFSKRTRLSPARKESAAATRDMIRPLRHWAYSAPHTRTSHASPSVMVEYFLHGQMQPVLTSQTNVNGICKKLREAQPTAQPQFDAGGESINLR
jgi:hypothetical protein